MLPISGVSDPILLPGVIIVSVGNRVADTYILILFVLFYSAKAQTPLGFDAATIGVFERKV